MFQNLFLEGTPGALGGGVNTVVIAVLAAIGLVALIIGACRGFTRLSWGVLEWGVICALYVILYDSMQDTLSSLGSSFVGEGAQAQGALIGGIILAIGLTLAVTAIFGLLAVFVCPRKLDKTDYYKAYKRKEERESEIVRLDGREKYEDEEEIKADRRFEIRSGLGKPRAFNRIVGAIVTFIESLMLSLFLLNVLAYLGENSETFASLSGTLGFVKNEGIFEKIYTAVSTYFTDALFIAVILSLVRSGFRKGFLKELIPVFASLSKLASVVLAFLLPFTGLWFTGKAVETIQDILGKVIPMEGLEMLMPILAKIVCAILLLILFLLLSKFLTHVFKKLKKKIDKVGLLSFFDKILAVVFMIVVALAIIALVSAVFVLPDLFGWFETTKLCDYFQGTMASNLFGELKTLLQSLIDGLGATA